MKAVIVLGGDAPAEPLLLEAQDAFLIAADGGGNLLHARHLTPDLVVGDMDSIDPNALAHFERSRAEIVRHPPAKDHTDGQLAVDLALSRGATEIVLGGGTGGRIDHQLAVFGLMLRAARRGARVRALEPAGTLWTAAPGAPLELDLPEGAVVSVHPLTEAVEGVILEGFEWPLTEARLQFDESRGLSNRVTRSPQRVLCREGVLLVILPREAAQPPTAKRF